MPRLVALLLLVAFGPVALAQTPREKKVRDDKVKVEADGYWIYNDVPKAFAEAKASGKPIAVVLRCVPCEECVKLDDDLVNSDATLRPLLDQYVRVRVVSANGLDLSLFQYDYDQSFAALFLNADGTVYGRFGTRSHRTNWVGDVSLGGLAKALAGGLELHADYPKNKAALAGKRGPAAAFATPELFPSLMGKYTSAINYQGNVVQSCIHCHQVEDAVKAHHRSLNGLLAEEVVFPYPHPKSQGLTLDPKERATVLTVEPDSTAGRAGFRAGDVLRTLDGQPLLSMADVQWALQRTPAAGGALKAGVSRAGQPIDLTWTLPKGWRQRDDISWRASSWGLRRMATGGMVLESAAGGVGLRVKHVGQFAPHDRAKVAGFRVGDILTAYDGRADLTRETDVLYHGLTARKPGDAVAVTVRRGDKTLDLTLPIQE